MKKQSREQTPLSAYLPEQLLKLCPGFNIASVVFFVGLPAGIWVAKAVKIVLLSSCLQKSGKSFSRKFENSLRNKEPSNPPKFPFYPDSPGIRLHYQDKSITR